MVIHFNGKYVSKAETHWVQRRQVNMSLLAKYKLQLMLGEADTPTAKLLRPSFYNYGTESSIETENSNMLVKVGNFDAKDLRIFENNDLYIQMTLKSQKIGSDARPMIVEDRDTIVLVKGQILTDLLCNVNVEDCVLLTMSNDDRITRVFSNGVHVF